jgi:retron-type reverse transcriptase
MIIFLTLHNACCTLQIKETIRNAAPWNFTFYIRKLFHVIVDADLLEA